MDPKDIDLSKYTFDKLVKSFVTLRDHVKTIEDKHKAELAPMKELRERLEAAMLDKLNATGQDSAKTAFGTVYRTMRESASLEDATSFMRHVIGSEAWDLLDRKANTPACKKFAEENGGNLPPGVKFTQVYTVGVRRA